MLQFSCSVWSDSATPWTAGCQAALSIINSWSLLKLRSIELVMPSNHLILCRPPLSLLHGPTLTSIHDHWKNHSFDETDLCWQVMSLLFDMLSRLVIAFLPRSKRLLISWLQSPTAVILEPPKIKSFTVSIASPSICHEVMGPDAMILVF